MKSVSTHSAVKFQNSSSEAIQDALTVEEVLQININYIPYSITMRSPGADRELVRGLLFTEEIFTETDRSFDQLMEAKRSVDGVAQALNVIVEPDLIKKDFSKDRAALTVASCGLCGKRKLDDEHNCGDPIETNFKLSINSIPKFFDLMSKEQVTFNQTGGSHASAAFSENGNLLAVFEDIGRHNAVDKVIGSMLENYQLNQANCLLVSGRISYEIVNKAYRAGIPFLAAVSAASSLAVETADELGITLIGFCRGEKATIYSHSNRVVNT